MRTSTWRWKRCGLLTRLTAGSRTRVGSGLLAGASDFQRPNRCRARWIISTGPDGRGRCSCDEESEECPKVRDHSEHTSMSRSSSGGCGRLDAGVADQRRFQADAAQDIFLVREPGRVPRRRRPARCSMTPTPKPTRAPMLSTATHLRRRPRRPTALIYRLRRPVRDVLSSPKLLNDEFAEYLAASTRRPRRRLHAHRSHIITMLASRIVPLSQLVPMTAHKPHRSMTPASHHSFRLSTSRHFAGAHTYQPMLDTRSTSARPPPVLHHHLQQDRCATSTPAATTGTTSMATASAVDPVPVAATDPFYVFTSGTTRTPKGIVPDNGGTRWLCWSMRYISDMHPVRCSSTTSDVGWVVGQFLIVSGRYPRRDDVLSGQARSAPRSRHVLASRRHVKVLSRADGVGRSADPDGTCLNIQTSPR